MPFDFEGEVGKIRDAIDELREHFGQSADQLRVMTDFSSRALELNKELEGELKKLPPELTPPQTEITIDVEEEYLASPKRRRPQTKIGLFFDFLRTCVWLDHRLEDYLKRVETKAFEHTIVLLDPRMPGSPAVEFDHQVQVTRARPSLMRRPRRWWRRVVQSWRRISGRAVSDDVFNCALETRTESVPVHLDEVPPDAPLTPAQEAYATRMKELAEEVQSIKEFIDAIGGQVEDMEARTKNFQDGVDQLHRDADGLPDLPDAAGELSRIQNQIELIRQRLPDREQKVTELVGRVEELRERARKACPELPL